MNISEIKTKIEALFAANRNKPLSYSDICFEVEANKKDKEVVKLAITELFEQNKLTKSGKRFKLKDIIQVSKQKSSALIEGTFDATPLARNLSFAFVKTDQGDYFVSSEDILNAYHGDTVLIEGSTRRGNKLYGVVRDIKKRANENLAGDVKRVDSNYYFICSNPKIHNWFNIIAPKPDYDGKKVVLSVSNWGNRALGKAPVGKVLEVLGDTGNPEVEVLGIIRQYNLPLEFPEAVIIEATAVQEVIPKAEIKKRRDLRQLFTFTIDPASAKDFDDAISLVKTPKGYELYVHIADVAHYVQPGSALFLEAVNRGNSYYFPKRVIPMLPEKLSNKVCSLRPDEDKLTMTVFTAFDARGKVIKQEIFESVIRSNFRLAYEEVDDLFDGKKTDMAAELQDVLHLSRQLSTLLSKVRKEAGYIFFDLPDIEYIYNQEGYIKTFSLAEETESHKLIENFMLIANEYIAMRLTTLAPATLYRIHEDPDMQKIERLATTLSYYGLRFTLLENLNKSYQALLESMPNADFHTVFDRMVLRSMKKAKYSIEPIRHFGLSIESYTHFTSPIRRLCDLIIHHLCKMYIIGNSNIGLTKEQCQHYADVASDKELIADESEREIERVYNRAYMKNKIGEKYSALVIGVKSSGLILRLNELPITGVMNIDTKKGSRWDFQDQELRLVNRSTGTYYQLMDKVKVQVMDVSDDIYFEQSNEADSLIHAAFKAIDVAAPRIKKQEARGKTAKTYHKRRK